MEYPEHHPIMMQPTGGTMLANFEYTLVPTGKTVSNPLQKDAALESGAGAAVTAPSSSNKKTIRLLALIGLVIVDSAIILTMKQASITRGRDGKDAVTTTVVCMVETFKVAACGTEIMVRRWRDGGISAEVREEILGKPKDTMLLLVPAFLYLVQNNLSFVAVANLEAVVQQNVSQLKILTTAVFSVIVLKRTLTVQQWSSLVMLTIGCAVVQTGSSSSMTPAPRPSTSPTLGLICALTAVSTSGVAGVYCEKMLKSGSSNMAIRNIQLGVPALILGLLAAYISDGEKLRKHGFFQGYTWLTWIVVCLGSLGGLLVTVIMKYGDNIVKTIAVAISLVVSTTLSIYLFNFIPTLELVSGSALVVTATFLYANLLSICA